MTPLTPEERIALSMSSLPANTPDGTTWPYGWAHVRHTQLSVARHTGGIVVNGTHYTYFPATDELWRDDVCQFITKLRKEASKAAAADAPQQLGLGV